MFFSEKALEDISTGKSNGITLISLICLKEINVAKIFQMLIRLNKQIVLKSAL